MPQKNLLITDFFSKSRPTTASNAAVFERPIKVIKNLDQSTATTTTHVVKQEESIVSSSSNSTRLKFVRYHSAPLHLRSPIKMREQLMQRQDLDEIRDRIRTFKNDLRKYKSTYCRSPVKRPHDTTPSPFKLPTPQTPVKSYPTLAAYQRFSPIAKTIELPLPDKYQLLFEQYKHLDFVVCHTHNSGGIPTFNKIQQAIQQKTKRNFTLQSLGRIKTVCPTMYLFRQEQIQLPTLSPMKLKFELTVTPNFDGPSEMQITAAMIVDRIDHFRRSLLELIKSYHQTFLADKLQLTIEDIPNDDKLVRWHPDFDLFNVPDIAVASLPESPDIEQNKLASPLEIRRYAQTTQSERVKRALFKTFGSDESPLSTTTDTITLRSASKEETFSINGLSSSLIAKIRSKETNKTLLSNSGGDGGNNPTIMLSRLEQTIEIVQQYFLAERATALEFDLVARQVRDCHAEPLSYGQAVETLHFLNTYPNNNGWLSMFTIRTRRFIKVNRHKSIKCIIDAIQQQLHN